MRKLMLVLVAVLAVGMVVGCGGPKVKKINEPTESSRITDDKSEPDWVARGGGIYEGEYGKAIYAVGSAAKAPSYHLMMSQSQARARAELSRILSVTVQSMQKDFSETAGDLYDPETKSAIEFFQDVSRSITNNTLVGSEKVASWKAGDGTLFVLMKISLDTVIETFKNETKSALKRKDAAKQIGLKADKAMSDLDAAVDKTAINYTNKQATETK